MEARRVNIHLAAMPITTEIWRCWRAVHRGRPCDAIVTAWCFCLFPSANLYKCTPPNKPLKVPVEWVITWQVRLSPRGSVHCHGGKVIVDESVTLIIGMDPLL